MLFKDHLFKESKGRRQKGGKGKLREEGGNKEGRKEDKEGGREAGREGRRSKDRTWTPTCMCVA